MDGEYPSVGKISAKELKWWTYQLVYSAVCWLITVVFDMGLGPKAIKIVWVNPDLLSGVLPCAGGMHLLMTTIAAIVNLYGEARLRPLLHKSGVFAAGTMQWVLTGRGFDRGLYALKLVNEALSTRLILSFAKWCEKLVMTSREVYRWLEYCQILHKTSPKNS